MALKIEKIVLKEMEIREVEGEYEQHFYNEKTYPIFLTNYALKKGKEKGLIESSLFSELAKLSLMQSAVDEEGNMDPAGLEHFDEQKVLKVIYMALIGANRNTDISYEEFLEKYHDGLEDTLELYGNLIGNLVSSDPNQFAKEFERATEKGKKK